MKKIVHYSSIAGKSMGFWGLLGFFGFLTALGMAATYYMEHEGHYVTGMSNQIVWGMPHVFAVFLIVAASGALNVASISSVFSRKLYKPLARMSGLLALCLLAGGLAILVLDLGRPDRLIVAMTKYNFKSIFAWNMILYNGFFAIVIVYLWMMMERKMNSFTKPAGLAAFIWRLTLTTGTGSIFGFIVAREAYDAAILAPMFIIMSFSFGLAIFILVIMATYNGTGRELGDKTIKALKNLLGVFVAAVLYFTLVYHLTNLYETQHHGVERFILMDGGIYTNLFWWGEILIGGFLPLIILYHPSLSKSRQMIAAACVMVIIGGLAQMYVIIIGGQAFPMSLFPGYEVSSSFYDGVVMAYTPSIWETALGIAGMAISMILVMIAIKVLPFAATSLEDDVVDPHHTKAIEAEAVTE